MQYLPNRVKGIFAILAGTLLMGAEITLDFFGSGDLANQTTADRISSLLFFSGALFLVFTAIALYQYHAEKLGRFGHAAFLLAIFGSVLMVSSDWTEFFALPVMVDAGIKQAEGSMIAGYILNYFSYSIGWLLAGIVMYRAKMMPRPATISLIAGVLLVFFAGDNKNELVQFTVWLLWYGSYIWMGWTMLPINGKRQSLRFAPVPTAS